MRKSRIELRVDPETVSRWTARAVESGLALSEWIRQQCDAAPPASPAPSQAADAGLERDRVPCAKRNAAPRTPVQVAPLSRQSKWVCECGQTNIGVPKCGRCGELRR